MWILLVTHLLCCVSSLHYEPVLYFGLLLDCVLWMCRCGNELIVSTAVLQYLKHIMIRTYSAQCMQTLWFTHLLIHVCVHYDSCIFCPMYANIMTHIFCFTYYNSSIFWSTYMYIMTPTYYAPHMCTFCLLCNVCAHYGTHILLNVCAHLHRHCSIYVSI